MADSIGNDTRGWIMSIVSGIACVLGATIICVDLVVHYIPGRKDFKIQESSAFIAASFSLSFGIMLFSALYSMLPSAKKYLVKGGYSTSEAAWILLACFACGFIGIQLFSRILDPHIPSHVVDCNHTHGSANSSRAVSRRESRDKINGDIWNQEGVNGSATESTSLLAPPDESSHGRSTRSSTAHKISNPSLAGRNKSCDITVVARENGSEARFQRASTTHTLRSPNGTASHAPESEGTSQGRSSHHVAHRRPFVPDRRTSMIEVPTRVMSFVLDLKSACDQGGPCYGYSEPCGHSCFRRIGASFNTKTPNNTRHPTIGSFGFSPNPPLDEDTAEEDAALTPADIHHDHDHDHEDDDIEAQHHHHVANTDVAFTKIGLQTSIAIALHKLPEGFITYSTNHANPSLGFSVFLALLVHNVAEGFALALPLYLSLHSRLKAMFWASILGGISQPLGAGIAALWFKVAGRDGNQPSTAVYGCLFAITSGIMVSVALHLFTEGLKEHHNRNLCIAFAFIGMILMAMSNALTTE